VLWREVFDAATTDEERWQALHGLADTGAEDLPQLDELTALTPWMADQLRARAALVRGDAQAAIRFAHPHRDTAAAAAAVLADAYVMLGELDAAVATLQEAADRFDFDDLVVHAALCCARAGHTQRAENLVTAVLGTGNTAWSGRSRALVLLGELQALRGAWEDGIASWTTALESDPHA
jgi:tetratricopeptide (TPR) repeat protein